jgi:hypothetical protein
MGPISLFHTTEGFNWIPGRRPGDTTRLKLRLAFLIVRGQGRGAVTLMARRCFEREGLGSSRLPDQNSFAGRGGITAGLQG